MFPASPCNYSLYRFGGNSELTGDFFRDAMFSFICGSDKMNIGSFEASHWMEFSTPNKLWIFSPWVIIAGRRIPVCSTFLDHIISIIFLRANEKAFNSINTWWSITFVKHVHAFRNRTSQNFPSKAVGTHKSPTVPKLTVAIGVFRAANPKPTFFGLLNPRPKPLDERREWMSYTTPPLLKFNFLTRLADRIKEVFAMAEVKITCWFDNLTPRAFLQGSTSRRWPDGWCVATPSGAGLSGSSSLATAAIIAYEKTCLKPFRGLQSMGVVA